jgi:hypothetical protein
MDQISQLENKNKDLQITAEKLRIEKNHAEVNTLLLYN